MTKNTSSGKTPEIVTEMLKSAVAGKGQSAVARESGIALYSVQRYLKGIGYPTEATFIKLAEYFGVKVTLLRDTGSFIEWRRDDTFDNKLISLASCHFESALENDYRLINEVFYIQIVVELARLIIEMPIEQDKFPCRENANRIIEKYEQFVINQHKQSSEQ